MERHWGVVFQQNGLFSGTTYDNIALTLRAVQGLSEKTIRRIVDQVITAVGLDIAEMRSCRLTNCLGEWPNV